MRPEAIDTDRELSTLGYSSSLFDEEELISNRGWSPLLNTSETGKMVNERHLEGGSASTGNSVAKPLIDLTRDTPEFGKSSPLRNPLRADASHIFNIPKPNKPRPEHHRPVPAAAGESSKPNGVFSAGSRPVEIHKPTNFPSRTTPAAPLPTYSSIGAWNGFQPINPSHKPQATVDLTGEPDGFDVSKALTEERFGAVDPYAYVEAAKANENIKALLEGAFDDDDDKPRTRRRKKAAETAPDDLAKRVEAITVGSDEQAPEATDEEEDDGTVEGLAVKLLPHQVEGLAWMTDREVGKRKKNGVLPKGGILADDMGLGKTIQSVALILTNPRPSKHTGGADPKQKIPTAVSKSTLVVAPLALIRQWEDEIKTKVLESHGLKVRVHHGQSRTKSSEELRRNDVVITTYQTLTSEHAGSSKDDDGIKIGCFGVHWYRIILDEAHSIKNRNAKSTQACYALESHYRWCLTGTPMQNNLDELQSLIRFLKIKPYDELKPWKEHITGPMKNGRGGLAMRRLQYFLRAVMKRRTKDVLKEDGALNFGGKTNSTHTEAKGFKIVERRVESITAKFNAKEQKFYDRLMKRAECSLEEMIHGEVTDYMGALVLLLRLRQACNHPELVRASIAKDKDALTTGSTTAAASQINATATNDIDEIAGMLGGLTVNAKQCDVCKASLNATEIAQGTLRCRDCEEDLASQEEDGSDEKQSGEVGGKITNGKRSGKGLPKRHQIDHDNSEEEGEGEWVVPKGQQHAAYLGKAGGTDDENAEGSGESLNSEDSETDEEVQTKPQKTGKLQSIDLVSSDDETSQPGVGSIKEPVKYPQNSLDKIQQKATVTLNGKRTNIAISTKILRLIQILRKECGEHKFIVFSQFTSMLDLIEPFLRQEQFQFTRYDGSMRNDQREASLHRLRNDRKTRVLLCSLKCGSLGLNLTAASRVVILEPFWNPFVEEQAIDRVHRLNQTVDVVVYKMIMANTVEEKILDLQESKRKLANAAIEGGKAMSKLSMRDIMRLFRRDAEHQHQPDEQDHAFSGTTRMLTPQLEDNASIGAGGLAEKDRQREKRPVGAREDPIYGRR